MKTNLSLRHFDFMASPQACQILSEYLSGHENIKKLRLYNNMSGNEGAFAIADILSSSTGIEEFRMASSRVGHEGGAALTRSLSSGTSVFLFWLSLTNDLRRASFLLQGHRFGSWISPTIRSWKKQRAIWRLHWASTRTWPTCT